MATQTQSRETGSWRDDWQNVRQDLRNQYDNLTDEDLRYQTGQEDELYQRVGNRIGKNRQETEDLFNKTYESKMDERGVGAPEPREKAERERQSQQQSAAQEEKRGSGEKEERRQRQQSKSQRQQEKEGKRDNR